MISKELTAWELGANYSYVPFMTRAAETGQILSSIMAPVPATVPGCVHNDLLRAGIIPDPYFEMNSLQCEWVEHYWWTYKTGFKLDETLRGRHLRLHMKGIDYEAQISLNSQRCGTHKGMYTPFKKDITRLVRFDRENILTVLLFCPPREMGQIGRTSLTHTQKARFPYKWDFSTRLVQIGLYDKVLIEDFGRAAIEYVRLDTEIGTETGTVTAESELTVFDAGEITVRCQVLLENREVAAAQRRVSVQPGTQTVALSALVPQPRLWYPNGVGEQPVYTVTITVEDETGLSDRQTLSCGFKQMQYRRAEGAPEECLPYSVEINGKRPYIKGVNMVPMDIMYGRIEPGRAEKFLRLAKQAHVNLIRIWGGGLIESEEFYDWCDRYGLMVWQEFIQSSSGIDNVPSKDPEFLELLRQTAVHAVRTKQHHPCLTFWCGGNELEDEDRVPSTFEDSNLQMLKEIVDRYDGKTLMLPTSASGFFEFLDVTKPGMNYDVHGPWKYGGAVEHYTVYNTSDSQLHSEFGVDGMNSYASIATVLSEGNLKVNSMSNDVWRHHGEMWDTYHRDYSLFGGLEENRLEDFILSSQFVQAEGIRYAVEANRRRAFSNVGSIIWQLNEPWPNVSGTNLVDYYAQPKLAYYGLKAAFRPANPSMRYEKLIFEPGEQANLQVFMTSDYEPAEWQLEASVTDRDNTLLDRMPVTPVTVGDGLSKQAGSMTVTMPKTGGVMVELIASRGEERVKNRYLLLVKEGDGYACREWMLSFASGFPSLFE